MLWLNVQSTMNFVEIVFIISINLIAPTNESHPVDVHFLLLLQNHTINLTNRTFDYVDPKQKTIILIYGWLTSMATDQYMIYVAEEYQIASGYNVIYIDWSTESYYDYLTEVLFVVRDVGIRLGETIMSLNAVGVDVKDIHLIGFSLGAHVCGVASRYVRKHHPLNETVRRISGLDPAGPLFNSLFGLLHNPYSLRSNDADVVDVTHTNDAFFGLADSIGTVDFYVNGGQRQPSCGEVDPTDWMTSIFIINGCSHQFAQVFYKMTLFNSHYHASSDPNACKDVIIYGDQFDGNATGIYYVRTTVASPFNTLC